MQRPHLLETVGSYATDQVTRGVADFLYGRSVETMGGGDLGDAATATLAVLHAVQTDDRDLFVQAVDALSRRRLRREAPWWMNDPLVFGVTLGAVKFDAGREWVRELLEFRIDNSTSEVRELASTLRDALDGNWLNHSTDKPVLLLVQWLVGRPPTPELVRETALKGGHGIQSGGAPTLADIARTRAYEVALAALAPPDPEAAEATGRVFANVRSHARFMGWLYWGVGLCTLALLSLSLLLWLSTVTDGWVKEVVDLLTFAGVPLAGLVPLVPWFIARRRIVDGVAKWVERKDFGYDRSVLDREAPD